MPKRYREYSLALLMLAASGLLALVLLAQWLHYHSREADLKKHMSDKVEVHMPAQAGEQERYALPGLEEYTATIERPLFMESRRPGDTSAPEPETNPVEKLPLNAKLMGVVLAPGQKPLGLFIDARGKYKRLHKDDSIGGWKIAEIAADKAIMEQDETRQDLKLFKPRPKRTNAQQPPSIPGAPQQPLPPGIPPPPDIGQPPLDGNSPEAPPPEPTDMTEPVEPEQPMPEETVDEIPVQPEEVPSEQ
jgi:hypothetical protein